MELNLVVVIITYVNIFVNIVQSWDSPEMRVCGTGSNNYHKEKRDVHRCDPEGPQEDIS
jgi:hypothetical protein